MMRGWGTRVSPQYSTIVASSSQSSRVIAGPVFEGVGGARSVKKTDIAVLIGRTTCRSAEIWMSERSWPSRGGVEATRRGSSPKAHHTKRNTYRLRASFLRHRLFDPLEQTPLELVSPRRFLHFAHLPVAVVIFKFPFRHRETRHAVLPRVVCTFPDLHQPSQVRFVNIRVERDLLVHHFGGGWRRRSSSRPIVAGVYHRRERKFVFSLHFLQCRTNTSKNRDTLQAPRNSSALRGAQ